MPIRDPFVLMSFAMNVMDELFFFSSLDKVFLFSSLIVAPVIWLLLRMKWWYVHGRKTRVSRSLPLRLGFLLLLALAVSLLPV